MLALAALRSPHLLHQQLRAALAPQGKFVKAAARGGEGATHASSGGGDFNPPLAKAAGRGEEAMAEGVGEEEEGGACVCGGGWGEGERKEGAAAMVESLCTVAPSCRHGHNEQQTRHWACPSGMYCRRHVSPGDVADTLAAMSWPSRWAWHLSNMNSVHWLGNYRVPPAPSTLTLSTQPPPPPPHLRLYSRCSRISLGSCKQGGPGRGARGNVGGLSATGGCRPAELAASPASSLRQRCPLPLLPCFPAPAPAPLAPLPRTHPPGRRPVLQDRPIQAVDRVQVPVAALGTK